MRDKISADQIQVGSTFVSTRITVTESHVVTFAGLTGDFNPLHMDAIAAQQNGFGKRIAHGMLGHALSTGLRSQIDDWNIFAFLESRRKYVAPILIGDTVSYRATVSDTRPSRSGKPFTVVTVEVQLLNQDGAIVQKGEDVFAISTKKEEGV
jgi:acyl dehydratase